MRKCLCATWIWMFLLTGAVSADVLEQAKEAAFELGLQTDPAPVQRSLNRMMTGLMLSVVGGRLLWYRVEDKDCRKPDGRRCDWVAAAGAASLASGLLLMTVLADVPGGAGGHLHAAARRRRGSGGHRLLTAADARRPPPSCRGRGRGPLDWNDTMMHSVSLP